MGVALGVPPWAAFPIHHCLYAPAPRAAPGPPEVTPFVMLLVTTSHRAPPSPQTAQGGKPPPLLPLAWMGPFHGSVPQADQFTHCIPFYWFSNGPLGGTDFTAVSFLFCSNSVFNRLLWACLPPIITHPGVSS